MDSKSWIKLANSCGFITQMGGTRGTTFGDLFFLQVLDTENLTLATFKSNHKLREAKVKGFQFPFPRIRASYIYQAPVQCWMLK